MSSNAILKKKLDILSLLLFASIVVFFCEGCKRVAIVDNCFGEVKNNPKNKCPSVLISKVHKESFASELCANGKLKAKSKVVVPFIIQGQIISIEAVNAQDVKQGQVLARVDCFKYEKALSDSKNQFEKACIDLEDQLLGLGYSLKDSASIPSYSLKIAKIRSGYSMALSNLKEAQYNYNNTFIRAPYDGVISDLEAAIYNHSSNYKKCCNVINDNIMKIEFSVLESELSQVDVGQEVALTPFALPQSQFIGIVTSINPSINENGMLLVTAEVKNPDGKLMDGMNTKVIIRKKKNDSIVIPKSAVLYRQNKKVVFLHENGLAKWVYIETGEENSTHVTITDGSLNPGQEVIISNNLNLAHDTPVKVVN